MPEKQSLIGCAGNSFECQRFFNEFISINSLPFKPTSDFAAIIIDDDKKIWYMENLTYVHEITLPFFAIGSGAMIAMGAMAKGATAKEAVLTAALFDFSCGDGVDEVRFE